MGKKKSYQDMSYEELEEVLLEKVHAYRTLQDANQSSGYDSAIAKIGYCLNFMSSDEPGNLEQLVRELRRQESEFAEQYGTSGGYRYLLLKKHTQDIRDAIDNKLEEMGMPVMKPGEYD